MKRSWSDWRMSNFEAFSWGMFVGGLLVAVLFFAFLGYMLGF